MRPTLFLVLFVSFVFGQFAGKTEVFPDGLSAGFSLDAFIEPVGYTLTRISSTSNCDVSVCDAGTVIPYRANYYDGTVNYICMCYDPIMDVDTTADRFGRVVYKVRNSVIGITVASTVLATGGAYSSGDVIRILQDSNTEVFTHEAAHSFDGRNGYSASAAFQAAVAADSCVPDNYAKSSYAEDFGQLIVTWTYIVVSNQQSNARFNCLSNQLAFVRTYLTEADILSIANGTGSLGAPCSQDYECGPYGQNYQYSTCTNGRCRCAPNFSGLGTVSDQCRCDGTVSYTTGSPVCLTPGTCQENWQCYEGSENSNFVSCNSGRCVCRSGFSGSGIPTDKCRCSGTVSWVNGTPFCV